MSLVSSQFPSSLPSAVDTSAMEPEPAKVDSEEKKKRDEIAFARRSAEEKRRRIIQHVKKIQPEAGKNLKDLEVPTSLYELAKAVANDSEPSVRFKKVDVYSLLMADLQRRTSRGIKVSEAEVMKGWKVATMALFRYALNLILAPKRVEFKKMKLSTSYYVYNISRNLYHAEKVFEVMGYRSVEKEKREGQDMVYEGDVNVVQLLETATDLLVMHEEVNLIESRLQRQRTALMTVLGERQREYEACIRNERISSQPVRAAPKPSNAGGHDFPANHENLHKHHHNHQSNPGIPDYVNLVVGPGGPVVQSVPPETTGSQAVTGPSEFTHMAPSSDHQQQMYSQAGSTTVGYQHSDQYYPSPSPSGRPPQSQTYLTPQPHTQYSAAGVPQPSQQVSTSDSSQQYSNIEELLQPQYGRQDPPHSPHYQQPLQQPIHQPIQQPVHQEAVHSDQLSGPEWVGARAIVATTFQNLISSAATARDDIYSDHGSDYNAATSRSPIVRSQPNIGHEAVNPSSKPPSPRKPTPAPRKTALPPKQPLPPSTEHAAEVEEKNILRLSMDKKQRMQHQIPSSDTPGSDEDMADTLPPPMTIFNSPPGATTHFESGIPSGLLSGIPRDNGDDLSPVGGNSGPQAMRSVESQSVTSPDQAMSESITSPNPPLQTHSESDTSIDLYGSGPNLQKQSSAPSVPPVPEVPEGAVTQPLHPTPTLVTQGSQDSAPHALPTADTHRKEKPTPVPRLQSKSKAQSVDQVEPGSREGGLGKMRSSASGSNLVEMERQSRMEATQNLGKSHLNRSPSGSPNSTRRSSRDRLTHEEWNPPALSPPSSPGVPLPSHSPVKPRMLPPKSQSVDVERQGKREVTRFSSGSNLLPGKSKPPKAASQANYQEPETPVVGIPITEMMKKKTRIGQTKPCDADTMTAESSAQNEPAAQLAPSTQPSTQYQLSGRETVPSSESPLPSQPSHALPLTDCSQDRSQDMNRDTSDQDTNWDGCQDMNRDRSQDMGRHVSQDRSSKEESGDSNKDSSGDGRVPRLPTPLLAALKTTAITSPTTAVAEDISTSKPDESNLDFGGDGTAALRQVQRERANAGVSRKRDKPQTPEDKSSFIEKPTEDGVTKQWEIENELDLTTELGQKFSIHLSETWECSYCTQLNPTSLSSCEVCYTNRESLV